MLNGIIVNVNSEKGFGFIKPDSGADVFFHHKALKGSFEQLNNGQTVQFELDEKSEKPRAKTVAVSGELLKAPADKRPSQSQRIGADRPRKIERSPRNDRDRRNDRDIAARRAAFGDRPARPTDDRFERPIPENCEFGHVVRIYRDNRQGKISADAGGKEILFEQKALVGQTFGSLIIGQYVQFAMKRETIGTDLPEAYFVKATERQHAQTIGQLARHPKSRAKKPTWRNKS